MISSTATGAAQSFVINHLFRYPALSIVRNGAADVRYYVYLPDGTLIYSIEASNGARHFYHFDEMGNTALLTGDDGKLSDSYVITPYGEIADHAGTTKIPSPGRESTGSCRKGRICITCAAVITTLPRRGSSRAIRKSISIRAKWKDTPMAMGIR